MLEALIARAVRGVLLLVQTDPWGLEGKRGLNHGRPCPMYLALVLLSLLAYVSLMLLLWFLSDSSFSLHLSFPARRIWHLQRLENDSPFDETWLDDHPCYGHNPSDVQPFFNLFDKLEETDQGVQVPKKYQTNIELYDLLRPDGIAIPYTYDNFEWPHCDVSCPRAQWKRCS